MKFTNLKAKEKFLLFSAVFIISRIIFFIVGIRFDHSPLNNFGQIIDVSLLKNRLLESLFYMHSQPPLFNGFLGIILKLFPGSEQVAFAVIYLIAGFGLYILLYKIMRELGVSFQPAFIISTVFIISPASVLYENWLFYTYPIAFFITLSTYGLILFIKYKKFGYSLLFFSLLAIMALLRQTFHPVIMLLIIVFLFIIYKKLRKNIILGSIIPIIVVSFVLIKNIIIFGTFSTSSWFGMNFANITIKYLPDFKKISMVEEGKLNKFALIPPFWNLPEYYKYIKPHQPFNIPVLDIDTTTTSNLNFNNYDYIYISKLYLIESAKALRYAPEYYLKNVVSAYYLYFRSPSDYRYFYNHNRDKIDLYDRAFNIFIYMQANVYTPLSNKDKIELKSKNPGLSLLSHTGIFSIIILPGLMVFSLIYIKKYYHSPSHQVTVILIYMIFNILLVTVIGNFIEVGENNRFRFEIEPLFYILFAFIFELILRKKQKE